MFRYGLGIRKVFNWKILAGLSIVMLSSILLFDSINHYYNKIKRFKGHVRTFLNQP